MLGLRLGEVEELLVMDGVFSSLVPEIQSCATWMTNAVGMS